MIISLFNSPSEIVSRIQDGSDIGWQEDSENSVFFTPFGSVQIIVREYIKNEIEINPIEGKTQPGWENLINYIHDEDRKMMEEIISRLESFGSINAREIMEMDEDEF